MAQGAQELAGIPGTVSARGRAGRTPIVVWGGCPAVPRVRVQVGGMEELRVLPGTSWC